MTARPPAGPQRPARPVAIVAVAVVFFLLGAVAARWAGRDEEGASAGDGDAGVRIVIDAGAIELLPDASLRLELPRGFDAGDDEPAR